MRFPTLLSRVVPAVIVAGLLGVFLGTLLTGHAQQSGLLLSLYSAFAILLSWYFYSQIRTLIALSNFAESLSTSLREFGRSGSTTLVRVPFELDPSGIVRNTRKMFRRLSRQRLEQEIQLKEQDAVLASMAEGVIAIDSEGVIIRINKAAVEMLGASALGEEAGVGAQITPGKLLHEAIRSSQLHALVSRLESTGELVEEELDWLGSVDRQFRISGRPIVSPDGSTIGTLLVISDITRLKRLENMRRDFVANVSHELKTPITAIKGCAETLLDGHEHSQEDLQKFLAIISRHADRLNSIFDDLLSLSRIEQDQDLSAIKFLEVNLKQLLLSAAQSSELAAKEKGISISVECPDDITVLLHPVLVEQAIHNLIDNAVKYSEMSKPVLARGRIDSDRAEGARVVIEIVDFGPGIELTQQARIFERFYRIDKARSRKVGGTGLGLSIVKHIAQVHGGNAEVKSIPGQGSTFALYLPLRNGAK